MLRKPVAESRAAWERKVVSGTGTSSSPAAHPLKRGSITFQQIAVLKVLSVQTGDGERSSAVYSGKPSDGRTVRP